MTRALTIAKRIKRVRRWQVEWESYYEDDSHLATGDCGYFSPKPSQEQYERYRNSIDLVSYLTDSLVETLEKLK